MLKKILLITALSISMVLPAKETSKNPDKVSTELKKKVTMEVEIPTALKTHPEAATPEVSLSSLIDMALRQNLTLKIQKLQIEQAWIGIKKADNSFIPNLDLLYTDNIKHNLDSAQKNASGPQADTFIYSLSLSQAFPALGKYNVLQKKLARLKSLAVETGYSKAELDLSKQIVKIFFQLVQYQETIKIHEENLMLIKKLLEIADLNMKVGLATKNDILRIEVQEYNIQVALLKTRNSYDNQLIDLANALNLDDTSSLNLVFPETLKFQVRSFDPKGAEDLMLKQDYDLVLSRNDQKVFTETFDAAKSAYLPTLSLSGKYNYSEKTGSYNDARDYSLGFAVSSPFYDGGDILDEIRKAEKDKQIMDLRAQSLENFKKGDLKKAYSDYREVQERVSSAEKSMEQAKENMRMVTTRYEHGDASIVEVIDAQITLTNSSLQAITTYYDERTRIMELLSRINEIQGLKSLDKGGARK
ncbi:MAG: TolC family protein [Candidatus Wallbacteria bacterium]|nr:TolC family protein [Candidatus Wallbacteria bacterium]